MKIEYDSTRDLLYLWLGLPGKKAAKTVTIAPGVHADLDSEGRLIGIKVLDASEVLGGRVQFEVGLPTATSEPSKTSP